MNYDITFCSKRNCTDKEFENLIDNTGHLKTFKFRALCMYTRKRKICLQVYFSKNNEKFSY